MMKNIFVVTDFSEASQNAGRYAVELAKHFNATVTLFHAYQVPVQVPETYYFYTPEDVYGSAIDLLNKEVLMINPGNKVKLEVSCIEGLPSDSILAEALKVKADLIVCGIKNSVVALRKIFGSTTSALIRKSEIPLIVVPEDSIFCLPRKIALASDLDPETGGRTVDLLKIIGEKFDSLLSVVWVVGEDFNPDNELRYRPSMFIKSLKSLKPAFEFPRGVNVTKALEGFVKSHDIDMLAMIPHKHDLLERFFTESVTKKMVFHSQIPLLILPQKKLTADEVEAVKSTTSDQL